MAGLNLDNRPWYVALIVGAIIAGALVYACEHYWFSGIRDDITARTNDLEALKQKVREGKVAEGRLPQFREEAERLETELQRLLRILPTAKQTDEIIKKVKSLTVDMNKLAPCGLAARGTRLSSRPVERVEPLPEPEKPAKGRK